MVDRWDQKLTATVPKIKMFFKPTFDKTKDTLASHWIEDIDVNNVAREFVEAEHELKAMEMPDASDENFMNF